MTRDEKIVVNALVDLRNELDVDGGDVESIRDFFLEIPPSLLNQIVLIEILRRIEYPREILYYFPGLVFSEPIKKQLLINDPDAIFFFPPEIQNTDINSWILAFQLAIKAHGFTGRHADPGIGEFWSRWVPSNIRRDPRMIQLKKQYARTVKELKIMQKKQSDEIGRQREQQEQQAEVIAKQEIDRIRQLSKYPKK